MSRTSLLSRVLVLGASLGSCLALAPRAIAQTSASETQHVSELFKSGKAAFAKGDMAEAERLFAEAWSIRKSSDIAANLGQSELEQKKFRAAADHFQWALVNLLPSATDAQRKAVETGLSRSRAEVGILRLEIKPDGSDVLVGQQSLGKSPVVGGVYVDPGEVIVSAKHDGFVAIDKRVMVGKGTEQAVELSLEQKDSAVPVGAAAPVAASGHEHQQGPAATASSADRPTQKSLVPAYVATAIAVAGGAVGVVFTLSANSKASDADALRDQLNAMGGCGGGASDADCQELKDQRKSVDSSRNLAVGSFVVGGVGAIVAGYFYWDALSHRGGGSAEARGRGSRRLLRVAPSFDMGRARGDGAPPLQSVKLSLSGTF